MWIWIALLCVIAICVTAGFIGGTVLEARKGVRYDEYYDEVKENILTRLELQLCGFLIEAERKDFDEDWTQAQIRDMEQNIKYVRSYM